MKTFYVVRRGWNAANQSSMGRTRSPKDNFESGYDRLVAIVEAESKDEAIQKCGIEVYNGQFLWATSNPKEEKGLTQAIRDFQRVPDSFGY